MNQGNIHWLMISIEIKRKIRIMKEKKSREESQPVIIGMSNKSKSLSMDIFEYNIYLEGKLLKRKNSSVEIGSQSPK